MDSTIYLAESHRWLHSKLMESAIPAAHARLVPSREAAELIIYPEPPWPDPDAADPLRSFSARERLRTFVFSQSDDPIPWAPGMYASLAQRRGPLAKAFTGGFYVAHHLRESGGLAPHLHAARALAPDLLWSFVGTAENAPVRQRLLVVADSKSLVEDTQRFNTALRWGWGSPELSGEAQRAFERYATTLGRSKFVVCPRGRGHSSIRLFEALEVGRCPVIVADRWTPPPFVDWSSCSIRIAENQVAEIPTLLRQRESEADELGRNARTVWETFFSPEAQLGTLINGCVELRRRIGPAVRMAVPPAALVDRSTLRHLSSPARSYARRLIGRGA